MAKLDLLKDIQQGFSAIISCTAYTNIIFGLGFLILSLDKSVYETDSCVQLREVSISLSVFLILTFLIHAPRQYICKKQLDFGEKGCDLYFNWAFSILFVLGNFLFAIIMTAAYMQEEQCGSLRSFAIFFIIILFLSSILMISLLSFYIIYKIVKDIELKKKRQESDIEYAHIQQEIENESQRTNRQSL